jgi:RNA methyltransferase, TrmH family
MISKAKVKYIKSLQVKKYRLQEQCFVAEGAKSVSELLQSDFEVIWLAASPEFTDRNHKWLNKTRAEVVIAAETELSSLGNFQTNDAAVAIARMKPDKRPQLIPEEWALLLDDIRDPGNLGAIIRAADWYGVKNIIASAETVDLYNPKVVSATMGSFCRVNVHYTNLTRFIEEASHPVYGAFLEGEDIHRVSFSKGGLIVIGNEANGISAPVEKLIQHRITIPRYGKAESLNAAMATGIILDVVRQSKK